MQIHKAKVSNYSKTAGSGEIRKRTRVHHYVELPYSTQEEMFSRGNATVCLIKANLCLQRKVESNLNREKEPQGPKPLSEAAFVIDRA